MIIELITPLLIATAPTAIISDQHVVYSHQTQTVVSQDGTSPVSYTSSATRTFDWQGKPNDADND
jgi:hypothetical protein